MSPVWAVVVTHNRREKLRLCLAALAGQRRKPDRILVVDNASTDGTRAMLDREHDEVEVLVLSTNEGGAGGFHEGMKHAYEGGAEWLWLMDDDTIPEADALAELLAAATRVKKPAGSATARTTKPARSSSAGVMSPGRDGPPRDLGPGPLLLASKVIWRDGSIHPLNFPTLERRRMGLVVSGAEQGVLPMRAATFVSLLVHRAAIERYDLPLKHYFLWSDDIEFTSRVVLGGEQAWFVPSSVAVHDTPAPDDFRFASPDRFYYHARNTLLIARSRDRPARDRLLRVWLVAATSAGYALRYRDRASVVAILRALRDALRRQPGGPVSRLR